MSYKLLRTFVRRFINSLIPVSSSSRDLIFFCNCICKSRFSLSTFTRITVVSMEYVVDSFHAPFPAELSVDHAPFVRQARLSRGQRPKAQGNRSINLDLTPHLQPEREPPSQRRVKCQLQT